LSLRPAAPGVDPKAAGTPSPEVTGPICRVPWPGVTRAALGCSPRSTCVGSRYGRGGSLPAPFSRAPGVGRTGVNPRLFPPSAGSRHYGTPRPSAVKRGGSPARPVPRRRGRGLRCRRAYPRGTGVLTRFPFGGCQLGPALGPANSRPIVVAGKPWSFPAEGPLTPLRCYYRRDLRRPRVHRTSRPGFCPTAAPPYPTRANGPRAGVSAAGLVPLHLRGPLPRRVRCYALLSRWLLLGPRPRCLRQGTPFQIDTKPALGGLNPGLGCSRLGAEAYPTAPASPHLRGRQVRSLTEGRGLSAPAPPISALPCRLPPGRPGCDPLRGEPAITGLGWSFAPSPRSWERFALQHPFGPPRGFSPRFTLPRARSPGFWSHGRDYRPFQTPPLAGKDPAAGCRFPCAFGVEPLKLATAVNSPARVSRRKGGPWTPSLVLPRRRGFLRVGASFRARPTVAARFQGLFTPLPGFFSAFPHGTSSLSDSGRA